MPDPTPTVHDTGLPYAETAIGEVPGAGFAAAPASDGNGVVFQGTCPRCGGPTTTVFRYGMPGLGTKGLRSWLAGDRTRPVGADPLHSEAHFCECGHAHPGMPAEAVFVGCGADWRVRSTP